MLSTRFAFPVWMRSMRFPSVCHICGAWPSAVFCEACVAQFAQPIARCPTCALPLESGTCFPCYYEPPPVQACLTAVTYGYPWSTCIASFKFQGDVGLSRPIAHLMRHAPWITPALEAADRVIAMPVTPARLRERGFNQAHALAKHLAPHQADALTLRRCDHASHQVGLDRTARLAQVRNTFWIEPSRIAALRGQRIVLLDDVMTTGATLHEAARTLRHAGVAHITAMVFARTHMGLAR